MAHWDWLRAQSFDFPMSQRTFNEYLCELDIAIERRKELDRTIAEVAASERWRDDVARLRCLRGIEVQTAMVILSEIQDFRRFSSAPDLAAFIGLVPRLYASGASARRGSITKAGNAHLRHVLVESSWHYRHPRVQAAATFRKRCTGQPEDVIKHAWKAQLRLGKRFHRLLARGKPSQVAAIAIARELCGFIWGIMMIPNSVAAPAHDENTAGAAA
jgi:transposase